jgi:transglutaminase-like putative cysteine protease
MPYVQRARSRPGTSARGSLRITRQNIPPGNAGVLVTVQTMRDMVRGQAEAPEVVEWAEALASPCCPVKTAEAVRRFLRQHVIFQPDPPGVEFVRDPLYMLRRIGSQGYAEGDCDDVATLGAALGAASYLPARFRLLSFGPAEPFEHVFTELGTGTGWVELDTTRPQALPPGLQVWQQRTEEVWP